MILETNSTFQKEVQPLLLSLPYHEDLILNYQALSDLPGFALLESRDQTRGRYDILSACPYERFMLRRDSIDLQGAFKVVQDKLNALSFRSDLDLPFQGGAIGYFSYDFAESLVGIAPKPHSMMETLPLVDLHFYDWAIVVDHKMRCVSLISCQRAPDTFEVLEEVQQRWSSPPRILLFQLNQAFKPLIHPEEYLNSVQEIQAHLKSGRAYQVNFTQPFIASYEGDSWEMYKKVRSKNHVPFSVFLRCDDFEILSFSPERFLSFQNGHLQTSPIKGSIKRSSDPKEDQNLALKLIQSEKNRAENIMIVDLLRNDLGKIAQPGSVRVPHLCELQSFQGVHHLVSDVEAFCLESMDPLQAFHACFPGGSITGAPKLEAMRIIHEQEKFSRGVYCGNIGYFSAHGRFDSNIAIRTVVAKDQHLYLGAGGGIVMDSVREDELQECYTKISAIVNALS